MKTWRSKKDDGIHEKGFIVELFKKYIRTNYIGFNCEMIFKKKSFDIRFNITIRHVYVLSINWYKRRSLKNIPNIKGPPISIYLS